MNKPSTETYIDVILPVAVPNLYTYHVNQTNKPERIEPGMRVCVQFGKRKLFTALVVRVHSNPPSEYETKDILAVLDDFPVVRMWQVKFWQWIAEYYMCTIGEVFNAALPNGLRPEGQTQVFPAGLEEISKELTEHEAAVLNILENDPGITIEKLNSVFAKRQVMPILRDMLIKGLVHFNEELKETFKPKSIELISLHPNLQFEDALNEILNRLERRAPKQSDVLLTYLSISGFITTREFKPVGKLELIQASRTNSTSIKSLVDKEIFVLEQKEVSRLSKAGLSERALNPLNESQGKALEQVKSQFQSKEVVLLHGVTSSGKTEIYIHLIEEQLKSGKQVLYLLPEIALTTQIISRLRNIFGDKVGVYHSKFSDAERVEVWNNLLDNRTDDSPKYSIILGVRSSIFLPFENLGLIIVDEEHENTYKQYDPSPRYHARDVAVVLAAMHKAKVLLGTATPAIESYFNARSGKYGLVELNNRFGDIQLPEIIVASTTDARKRKQMSSNFTPQLVSEIQKALNNQEQIILFQNRRGFSPYLECADCGWIPNCRHCDVSLTYHKTINKLICHYCGYSITQVVQCKACGSTNMQTRGFGTEKVEDDITILFPNARISRMDLDTTRRKKAYEEIIDSFASGEVDILIGTQMVSKGLDFDNVSIVGILNADTMLNFPDFRAYERSFQLMAQVSGRAGRKKKQGKVVIQTANPENIIVKQVVQNDYSSFYNTQLAERIQFKYPPFFRLINISVRHADKEIVNASSKWLANELRNIFGNRVLGPEIPLIGRIQNKFIKDILLKLERGHNLGNEKLRIQHICNSLKSHPGYSGLQLILDVDPF
jgi:primosomal protein N' (replication factor Y)